ncbi:transport and Golgi organization 2 homolog [Actinia tenebrosa]|uniref:Transport and Golgi organization 2 homolog n=1 Tax=Actinia tenebrosa TaxID=6105 RepID=A0A6P8H7Z4_ACTTE|nr:transport and Golgi organization 2 homolog [Actinia tenebrosa]
MCIVFLSYNDNPGPDGYKLIIASNRDEYYERPTEVAKFWEKNSNVIAGIDLVPGKEDGTWLGITKCGKFGALTNYRQSDEFISQDMKGRGFLVTDYLTGDQTCEEYLTELSSNGHQYNGFNLILGKLSLENESKFGYYCNTEGKVIKLLTPGIHVLSNRTLNFPWPKVVYGREKFEEIISKNSANKRDLIDGLMGLLNERRRHFPNEDDSCYTGPQDELLSDAYKDACRAIFVKFDGQSYGTRTNTIILVDAKGHVTYTERTLSNGATDPDDDADWVVNCHEFDIIER